MITPLAARISAALDRKVDPAITDFASSLAQENGALAVLFYGSNLRTGALDGVLDFYVLLPGDVDRGIWPRVSYQERSHAGILLRAKIATLSLATFEQATQGSRLDTTIWARFVQPSALVWHRDAGARGRVEMALAAAAQTAARLAAACGPECGTEADFWRALFRSTYRAELRVERPGREESILALNPDHFSGLLPAALAAAGVPFLREGDQLLPQMSRSEQRKVLQWWRRRRRLGRPLNVLRLAHATTTFDGAARYAAWKVHRHTGLEVEVTPWHERYPILAAPGFAWKIWRSKRQQARGQILL